MGAFRIPLFALVVCVYTVSVWPNSDTYGGTTDIKGKASGFFHVEKQKTGWQLIDPDGNGFFCAGMDLSVGRGDTALASRQMTLMRKANFTAFVGGGRGQAMKVPYAKLTGSSGGRRANTFKDVFAPAFEERAKQRIAQACSTSKNDPWLIGYYTDNELPWNMVWGGGFYDDYLNLPFDSAGHKEAIKFTRQRFTSIEKFNKTWGTSYTSFDSVGGGNFKPVAGFDKIKAGACRDDFLYQVSRRYHSFLYKEFKAVDPNHMVMGNRFLTGDIPMAVIRGMKGNVDVFSSNCYALRRYPVQTFTSWSDTIGAPYINTEYGYAAQDAGVEQDMPGAIPRLVATQAMRAERYEWYVTHAASSPSCIGCFWWYSKDGFSNHERGNFGFFGRNGQALYYLLYDKATEVNSKIYDIRAAGKAPQDPTPVDYSIKAIPAFKPDGVVDTAQLDITIDTSCRYEGFGFDTATFRGKASLRQDGKNLVVSLRVFDRRVNIYSSSWLKDSTRNIWEIDGMEIRLGRYESLFYFADSQLTYQWISADPFPGIVCAGKLLPDGYSMEISLPFKELVDVINNKTLLFAIGINDGEANKGRYRQLQWPKSFEWIYKESYARGKLAISK